MKAAIITPVFWPVGAIAYPHHMAKILKDAGHQVDVHTMDIYPNGKKIKAPDYWEGIDIYRYEVKASVGEFAKLWAPDIKGYDLIHFCGGYRHPHTFKTFIDKLDNTKVILSPFFPDKPRDNLMHKVLIPWIDKTIGKDFLSKCDMVLAETSAEVEWLKVLGAKNINILPNPLPDKAYKKYDGSLFKRAYKNKIKNKKIIFYLGGHSYIKNVEELIKVAPFIDAVFVIGGEGDRTESYIKLAAELGVLDRIIFPGSFFDNYTGKMEAFAAADLFILPSRHEGLGTVLLEAMAQTKPVIASNVGGLSDVVPDNFCLYELGNQHELIQKIKKILNDIEFSTYIGNKGRVKALTYSYNEVSRRYLAIITDLLR